MRQVGNVLLHLHKGIIYLMLDCANTKDERLEKQSVLLQTFHYFVKVVKKNSSANFSPPIQYDCKQ